jgi:alpha-glucosidase
MRLFRVLHIHGLFVSIATGAALQILALPSAVHADGPSQPQNGIEANSVALHERVTALRDDVLHITVWRGEASPEDASWAVLETARTSAVPVTRSTTPAALVLKTKTLAVEIDRRTLELKIHDGDGNIVQQDSRPVRFDGDAFRVYKTMPADEHYFGLGDKTGPLDRRDQAFTLWNTDSYLFQESTDPLYKSIPFFIAYRAGRTLGVLLDNTYRSSFDFGKESADEYSFGAAGGPVNYYLFYGPNAKQVVETYAWLTGKPPLPPMWSFGFQQSRYSYMSQERVQEVAERLRADRIPADAVYIDIDYQEKNRPFTINRAAFSDLAGMVGDLHKEHFHVVAITDPHIANLPGDHYLPFDSGMAGDHFVKAADGKVFSGRVWPGASLFPDFARKETRAWWGTLYGELRRTGVDGFWNDMNEPSVFDTPNHTMPLNAVHRIEGDGFASRDATHAEIHNVYGMENARATYEGLLALEPELRPFVLTRAAYAGAQRYGVTWTGDNSSSWNHLRLATPMIENLGLSGFAFCGADVGGYAGTPPNDLLTKWFEIGAFQPIDRDHTEKGTGDQEPWVGGEEQEAIRRRFVETRYRLMPYLYTLAEEASQTGLPVVRPLFLEFPDAAPDRHPLDIDLGSGAEFMLGSSLLVAPSPYPEQLDSYAVRFPAHTWYDFWTGEKIPDSVPQQDGSAPHAFAPLPTINETPMLDRLPVFVRGGSILPMAPLVESTDETPAGPLTLRVYAGEPCAGSLYEDDGRTFAYRRGVSLRMQFHCEVSAESLRITIGAREGSWPAWWKQIRVEVYGWTPASNQITIDGRPSHSALEKMDNGFAFVMADPEAGTSAEVR